MLALLLNALEETLFMVFAAGIIAFILGLPLAVIQVITRPKHLWPNKIIHQALKTVMHSSFSIPYLIFILALIPLILHTSNENGTTAEATSFEGNCIIAILPLSLAVLPVFVRECVQFMNQLSDDLIDTVKSLGASSFNIITKVLLPESFSGIVHAITVMLTHLVGYSVIAGVLGGGGLGELLLRKDPFMLNIKVLLFISCFVIVVTQIIQRMGNYLAFKKNSRNSFS